MGDEEGVPVGPLEGAEVTGDAVGTPGVAVGAFTVSKHSSQATGHASMMERPW